MDKWCIVTSSMTSFLVANEIITYGSSIRFRGTGAHPYQHSVGASMSYGHISSLWSSVLILYLCTAIVNHLWLLDRRPTNVRVMLSGQTCVKISWGSPRSGELDESEFYFVQYATVEEPTSWKTMYSVHPSLRSCLCSISTLQALCKPEVYVGKT